MSATTAFAKALRARDIEVDTDGNEDLERILEAATDRGRAAYDFELAKEDFAAYLGARVASAESLTNSPIEDLFLACGCVLGNRRAGACFQQRYGPEIQLALRLVPDAIDMANEISQLVVTQLLLPDDKGKRGIESYRGRGALFSWLRVVAVRRALRELGKGKRETALGDEQLLASLEQAPELGYMKELYRSAFRDAFAESLVELDYDARVLLRHHYVHGLSIDKLSALHRIHRATAARRLAKSRETLLQGTRRRLLTTLRVDSDELDSIMRLIASHLEASMGGLMSSSG